MSKSQYPYPPDEFDVRGPEGAPVGVHREPRSGWSSAWPFLLVAVVFAGLAVGVVSYLSDDGGDSGNPPTAAEQSAEPEASASEEASDGSGKGDGGGGESEEPTDEASDEPSEEPSESATMPGDPAAADLTARVVVYNDGAGTGQAGAASDVVAGAGFTDVGADDAPNAPVSLVDVYDETTVLYADGRADTASAAAEALGVDPADVQLSDDLTNSPTDAVWVVLKEPVG
ncbi:LytR C-terminal domain-containing protein [Isoptericola aurantiacus]|uniref:LytR C-terminal domain-containing protein n=1 Tax=Isoptericola aurantiacus TaxID=3377839 RepID=UPI00383B24C1